VILSGLPRIGEAGAASAKTISGQLTVGFSQEPTVFNPHLPHIEVDDGVHFALFDSLFSVDPEASSCPVSPPKFRPSRMAAFPPMA
jgi:peptide/nickel transport system substrate-binding protein